MWSACKVRFTSHAHALVPFTPHTSPALVQASHTSHISREHALEWASHTSHISRAHALEWASHISRAHALRRASHRASSIITRRPGRPQWLHRV